MSLKESDLNSLAIDVAMKTIPVLNSRLKAFALAAGWPESIVNSMSIEFEGGEIFINYPEALSDEIDDLEYGKPFTLPNPVIRPFIERNSSLVADVMAGTTVDRILELQEVF